ncbi:MAG: membrane protein insertion efficiency factor YidD [Syntrophaceae bacterium]|jgi:uncharacterized protein|nr:membrane protein insertion efficiency factor YidD [Syntrophaceae bacterium]HOC59592.1 membrane protein insertion efficiency factor YidD [Smithellaceae bacterium]HQM45410.1 membrane protein insertion efficiency factor YidD [Smithellaceae bacterium]
MFRKTVVYFLVFIIRFYQACISPIFFASCCRFIPTCSQYAIDALKLHGPTKGMYLGVKRILRCHPFNPGGYDPVK